VIPASANLDYPTSSPELNPAENAQTGEVEWKSDARSKMAVLRKYIARLDSDKRYWRNLFDSLRTRYKWLSENDGALLRN
jgi:hypothetical protein